MKKFSFTKNDRIIKKTDFNKLYKEGKKFYTKHFIVIVSPSGFSERRVGITVSKRVGGACVRNQVKRLLREFFRLNKKTLPPSRDFLFIAKKGASELNYFKTFKELSNLLFEDHLR